MQELTLTIDYCDYFSKELEEYLISLKGVIKSKINLANNEINIKYDSFPKCTPLSPGIGIN